MSSKRLAVSFLSLLVVLVAPLQSVHAWGRFDGGIHPAYDPHFHRDPVVVHREYVRGGGGGCAGCGVGAAAVVGLVGGVILGTAIAANAHPVVVQEAPPQTVIVQQAPPYGMQVAMLPGGCTNMNINGTTFYRCNQDWYQPFMGGNGVYYTLIPPPM